MTRLVLAVALAAGLAPAVAQAAPPKLPVPPIYWTCMPHIYPDGHIGMVC
jgi:hypothetical protein